MRISPERSAASRTVVPAGTVICSNFCLSASAYTTSTAIDDLSIELFRSLAKGVHQGIGGLIEQRTKRRLDQRPGVIEGQIEADLARLLAQRLELPDAVQVTERPFFNVISMRLPTSNALRVMNRWLSPALATVMLACISVSLLESTSVAEHQGRNCG